MTPRRRFLIGRAFLWAAVVAAGLTVPALMIGALVFGLYLACAAILFVVCGVLLLGEDRR